MGITAEVEKLGDVEFRWLKKRGVGGKNKEVQFYESFWYDDVEYTLYDCVYMYTQEEAYPYIGKIVKIWQNPDKSKKVKVQWFFRPSEVTFWLKKHNVEARENEIFFASGEGVGLANINPLEAIAGKCNVICISEDSRNPQLSEEQLQMADYVFYRTFDVGSYTISEIMDDKVGGLEVNFVFNRKESEQRTKSEKDPLKYEDPDGLGARPSKRAKLDSGSIRLEDGPSETNNERIVKYTTLGKGLPKEKPNERTCKLKNHSLEMDKGKGISEEHIDKKARKLASNTLAKISEAFVDVDEQNEGRIIEVTRRPDADKGKWFMSLPWEERMQSANEKRTLVLLQNLDPDYTSGEVEDIVWSAFRENCEAKVVQRTAFSSPHSGQAFVIFKTREAAERVIAKLSDGCLILPNRRPLSGRMAGLPKFRRKQSSFVGHLFIDKVKFQMQKDMKDALSTSHCSQPNTIEYDLALEWCLLQLRCDFEWEALYKQQGEELKNLRAKLKSK